MACTSNQRTEEDRMSTRISTSIATCAMALAIGTAACNSGDREAGRDAQGGSAGTPAATSGGDDRAPTTVTGCLQRGDDDDVYILTQVNQQPGPVATSGERASTEVQQKQQQAAARSYRLSRGPDNLGQMVGHEVRVTGTVSDRGDVQPRGESGEIKEGDLATIEVTSAESVADACGTAGNTKGGERRRP
jgi:hypothetical protein